MFKGEYNHTIDEKGRLIIPAKFREELGNEFVVTRGLDGCLFGYNNSEWEVFEGKLRALPLTNKDARAFQRYMLAGAASVEIDKQGRILLPQSLRTFAGLEKDVVLIGVAGRIEIWNKDIYEKASAVDDMEEIAEKMSDLGI
ncbi:MAG: division/cell wall cluster transcriptional repressor MraZ [Lachnospiraceae bacterium]|jgi:MraZ protein|nr:division/cell wall cluster transcriptional repressor MraZ [Lachnospiraceae bacterium]